MVQEAYPGSDMEGGRVLREYMRPKSSNKPPENNTVEDIDKEVLTKACELICKQTEELVKLRIENEKLKERLSWKDSTEPVYIVK